MKRKEDKLRPYRVDYFKIDEMKDNDFALIRSVIVRTVTAADAIMDFSEDNRVIIRARRYYKNLVHKKDVYKAVEDLFTANKAVAVMSVVEAYRAAAVPSVTPPPPPPPTAPDEHVTRMSDSSLYDEVCVKCGATD